MSDNIHYEIGRKIVLSIGCDVIYMLQRLMNGEGRQHAIDNMAVDGCTMYI